MPERSMGESGGDTQTMRLPLGTALPLQQFLANRTPLAIAERQLIVEQAIGALQHVYVHLEVKRRLYLIDPVARLRALRDRLDAGDHADDLSFHREMMMILRSCRDMHTGYYLPRPFDRSVAFLPFQIEVFHEGGKRRYLVPRVLLNDPDLSPEIAGALAFQRGVEILAWDGDAIDDAVLREGEATPGITPDARRARGIYRLTTRVLAKCPPPERPAVRVTFCGEAGRIEQLDAVWRVVELPPGVAALPEGTPIGGPSPAGLDFETEVFRALKKELNARQLDQGVPPPQMKLPTVLGSVFEAFERVGPDGTPYGYLRIRSFSVEDDRPALAEFVRLVGALPEAGLVIDVRDNPGGSIRAAEMMLQALASRRLERASLVFRPTPFVLRLCERLPALYAPWIPTIARALRTGVDFSGGVPLWPDAEFGDIACCHPGPVVLIVNALSYSATEFFAAGFQDHGLGRVLGVDRATGGGGANVRTLNDLAAEVGPDLDRFADLWAPVPLPGAADIHVAFRRSVRTGSHAGLEVEDLGVVPDAPIHLMTKRDAMDGNPDLFEAAARLLTADPPAAPGSSPIATPGA